MSWSCSDAVRLSHAGFVADAREDLKHLCSGLAHPCCERVVVDAVPLPSSLVRSETELSFGDSENVS